MTATSPILIPIAAGKGGVGKTFLTANLGIALAEAGHTCVAVDLDLGGSNLHSFLGIANEFPGVGDFVKARCGELEDLLVPTGTPGLSLLPGDGRTPFMANITYGQKRRLISHLRRIRADYVLLDLAAGTSFNTLDFFGCSNRGLMVTRPELPSIMNMLTFQKHFLLRAIERRFTDRPRVRERLRGLHGERFGAQAATIRVVRDEIAELDADAAREVDMLCEEHRPRIVFNMGHHPDDLAFARNIDEGLRTRLCVAADYFGFVFEDPAVRAAIRERRPLLPHHRGSVAAEGVVQIAERIVRFWDRPVDDSAERLLRHARRAFARSNPSEHAVAV